MLREITKQAHVCAAEEAKDGWVSSIDGGAQRAPLEYQTRATEPYYFNAQWGYLVRPCPRNQPHHFHKPVVTKQGLVLVLLFRVIVPQW